MCTHSRYIILLKYLLLCIDKENVTEVFIDCQVSLEDLWRVNTSWLSSTPIGAERTPVAVSTLWMERSGEIE